jgi:hypothetical protein
MSNETLPRKLLNVLCSLELKHNETTWSLTNTQCGSVSLTVTWNATDTAVSSVNVQPEPPVVITRKPPATRKRDEQRNEDFFRRKRASIHYQRTNKAITAKDNTLQVSTSVQTDNSCINNNSIREQTVCTLPTDECVHNTFQTETIPPTITSDMDMLCSSSYINSAQSSFHVTVATQTEQRCDINSTTDSSESPSPTVTELSNLKQILENTNKHIHDLNLENVLLKTTVEQQKVSQNCVNQYAKDAHAYERENEQVTEELRELQHKLYNKEQELNDTEEECQIASLSANDFASENEHLEIKLKKQLVALETQREENKKLHLTIRDGARENSRLNCEVSMLKQALDSANNPPRVQHTERHQYQRGRRR